MWQDAILMVGGILFTVALIPSVVSKEKPHLSSSIITGSILVVFCACYATLGLWLAFGSTLVTASTWYLLAAQVAIRKKSVIHEYRGSDDTGL